MFEGIKNRWKWLKENRRRRDTAKKIEKGKLPHGRTAISLINAKLPSGPCIKAGLRTRIGISAKVTRVDGSIEELGEIYKEVS